MENTTVRRKQIMKRLCWVLLVITVFIGLQSCQKKAEQGISQQQAAQNEQTVAASATSNEVEAIHTTDSRAFEHEELPIPDFSSFPVKEIENGKIQGRRFFNDELGFSFVVPEGVEIEWPEDKNIFYFMKVDISNPEDLPGEVEQFERIKKNLALQKIPDVPTMPSNVIEYVVKGTTNIAIEFYTGFDTFDGFIGKRLVFIKNNKLVKVNIVYYFPGPKMTKEGDIAEESKDNIKVILNNLEHEINKKYNIKYSDIPGPYKDAFYFMEKEFREGKMNEKLPREVQDLITKFDYIIATLRLY